MIIDFKQSFTGTFGWGVCRSCALLCALRGKWGCAPHQDYRGQVLEIRSKKTSQCYLSWLLIVKHSLASGVVLFSSLKHSDQCILSTFTLSYIYTSSQKSGDPKVQHHCLTLHIGILAAALSMYCSGSICRALQNIGQVSAGVNICTWQIYQLCKQTPIRSHWEA